MKNLYIKIYFILLFVAFLLFYYHVFNPEIYYNRFQILFVMDRYFLFEFLAYPGGPAEWISLFIFQFFYFKIAGAVIFGLYLIGIHCLLYLCCRKYTTKKSIALFISAIPVVLLFGVQSDYNLPIYFINKIACLAGLMYLSTRVRKWEKPLFVTFFPVYYYLIGGWFFLVFTLFAIMHELSINHKKTKFIYTGIYLLLYSLLPYLAARYWFVITLEDAYLYNLPYTFYFEPYLFQPSVTFYLFHLILILIIPATRFYNTYIKDKHESLVQKIPVVYRSLAQTVIIIALFLLSFYYNFDLKLCAKLKIENYAGEEQWEEIIRESQNTTEGDRETDFYVNMALYHLNDLLDKMFSFDQRFGVDGLFLTKYMGSQIAIPSSDLYYDLGHISASRVMAYEGLTKYKYHPKILKRLVFSNIILGDAAAARKFIVLLKKSIIYRSWTLEYEKYIENPAQVQNSSVISQKHRLALSGDFFIANKLPRVDLLRLVQTNRKNKMAVDYLFAYYLLEGNLKAIYENRHLLDDAGYTKMPQHVQEAVLQYGLQNRIEPKVLIQTCSIDTVNFREFIKFSLLLRQNYGNEVKAKQVLGRQYGKTYWYYLHFLHPKITGLELKSRFKDVDMYKLY